MLPYRYRSFVAGALLATTSCDKPKPTHGTSIADPLMAPPLLVHNSRGQTFDLAAERGKPVFVYFGYTHCPDVCPTTLADWARAKGELGKGAAQLRFVFVSVDPDRDTPAGTESYAWQFDSSFVGLAPTAAQLDTIKATWGFAVQRNEMPGMKRGEYGVTHPSGVFYIDRAGRVAFVFAPGTKPAEIAADLRTLL